jgi:hypothetical protein
MQRLWKFNDIVLDHLVPKTHHPDVLDSMKRRCVGRPTISFKQPRRSNGPRSLDAHGHFSPFVATLIGDVGALLPQAIRLKPLVLLHDLMPYDIDD